MGHHPWNRLTAWCIDWLCILAWIGVTAAVGIPLYLAGVTGDANVIVLNLVAFVVMVAPVTITIAALESGRREGTVGKRVRRLIVQKNVGDEPVSFRCALLRNIFKIAIPWGIGHAAVYEIVRNGDRGSVSTGVVVVTAAAYVLPLVYVFSLFIRTGRTPYDWVAGTSVIRRP